MSTFLWKLKTGNCLMRLCYEAYWTYRSLKFKLSLYTVRLERDLKSLISPAFRKREHERKHRRDSFEYFFRLCRTNTGSHFLDSGGIYGYQYQKPLPKEHSNPVTLRLSYNGEIECSLSLAHVLYAFCKNTPEIESLQREFEEFCKLPDNEEESWLCNIEEFLESHENVSEVHTFNSYNGDSDLDQVLQGIFFKLKVCGERYRRDCIAVQPHCGCDVRGGYPKPELYELTEPDYFYGALGLLEFNCTNGNCHLGIEYSSVYDLNRKLGDEELKFEVYPRRLRVEIKRANVLFVNPLSVLKLRIVRYLTRKARSFGMSLIVPSKKRWYMERCARPEILFSCPYPVFSFPESDRVKKITCPCGGEVYAHNPCEY